MPVEAQPLASETLTAAKAEVKGLLRDWLAEAGRRGEIVVGNLGRGTASKVGVLGGTLNIDRLADEFLRWTVQVVTEARRSAWIGRAAEVHGARHEARTAAFREAAQRLEHEVFYAEQPDVLGLIKAFRAEADAALATLTPTTSTTTTTVPDIKEAPDGSTN